MERELTGDQQTFWFMARRKVWAWVLGNRDEIEALWVYTKKIEKELQELKETLNTQPH